MVASFGFSLAPTKGSAFSLYPEFTARHRNLQIQDLGNLAHDFSCLEIQLEGKIPAYALSFARIALNAQIDGQGRNTIEETLSPNSPMPVPPFSEGPSMVCSLPEARAVPLNS